MLPVIVFASQLDWACSERREKEALHRGKRKAGLAQHCLEKGQERGQLPAGLTLTGVLRLPSA